MLLSCSSAHAATITVNTTADELLTDGNCSLREAIQAANTDTAIDTCAKGSGADLIVVPAGSYDFSAALAGSEDNGLQGDLDIKTPMTILGAGAVATTVDAESLDRVFDVVADVPVTIAGLTIRGGKAPPLFLGIGLAAKKSLPDASVSVHPPPARTALSVATSLGAEPLQLAEP